MDTSRRAVESYWRSWMIDAVTSDEDKVAPVYKLEELCDAVTSEFILKCLDNKSPIVKQKYHKRFISELTLDKVSSLMGSFSMLSQREVNPRGTMHRHTSGNDLKSRSLEISNCPPRHKRNASDFSSISSRSTSSVSALSKRSTNLCFDEKLFLQSLYKVLVSVSEKNPLIIYLRDVEKFFESERFFKLFQRLLNKLSSPVLILGSRVVELEDDCQEVSERISALFPYNIEIRPPEDESQLVSWKSRLEEDMKMIHFQDNKNHITEVLTANDIQFDDLASICHADTMCLSNHIEEIVVSAISYHLIHTKELEYRNGKLVISSKSLSHGVSIFQEGGNRSFDDSLKLDTNTDSKRKRGEVCSKSDSKPETSGPENKNELEKSLPSNKNDNLLPLKAPKVSPDNEFEKRIRLEVIPADEIGVTFVDIGSLDETKESLQELVMLALQRPDLFQGGIFKPCRGILLVSRSLNNKSAVTEA